MSAVSAKINANLLDVVQQERIEEPGAEMSYIVLNVLINMTIRVLPDPSPHWSKCKHVGRDQVASEIPEYVTATPHPCFWNPQTFVHQGPEMALKAKKQKIFVGTNEQRWATRQTCAQLNSFCGSCLNLIPTSCSAP